LKWYKHLTASGTDPDIGELIDELGFKGYYLFFRTLEIMSIEYDISNPGQNLFNFDWFLNQFSRKINQKTLLKFLQITNKTGRILYQLNGKDIHLNCPKLKHLTDEYTRQKPYRDSDKVTEKVTEKVTPLVTERVTPKIKDIRIKNKEKNKELCPNTKYSDVHMELSFLLEKKIKERIPKHLFTGNSYLESWANTFRIMDGNNKEPTPDEIRTLILWIFDENDFWFKNILSADTLRKQFGRLWAEMEGKKHSGRDTVGQPISKQKTDKEKDFDAAYLIKRKELEDKYKDQIKAAKGKDQYLLDEIECAIKEELTEWTENRL